MVESAGQETDGRWFEGVWRQPAVSQALVFTLREVIAALLDLASKRASLHVVCTNEDPSEDNPCDCSLMEMSELASVENIVELRCASSSLFAAIACESMLNQFCFFNFSEDLSNSVEKLQPTEKLLIAASILGHEEMKSNNTYALLKQLMAWRNRFAHGHNPDAPTKTLARNHTVLADDMQNFEEGLREFPKHMQAFTELYSWVADNSRHHLVKFSNRSEFEDVKHFLKEFACFRFSRPKPHHIYELIVDHQELDVLMKQWEQKRIEA